MNPKSLPIPAAQERSRMEAKAAVGEGFVSDLEEFQFYQRFSTLDFLINVVTVYLFSNLLLD